MKVPVVVLAGGRAKPSAIEAGWPEHRALAPVGGRPTLAWVLDALRASGAAESITVVGPEEVCPLLAEEEWLPTGETMWDNVHAGLSRYPHSTTLLCGSDIPLLSAASVRDVVREAAARDAEFVYTVIRREDSEAQCPGLSRTWATLKEGTFTGGNLMTAYAPALLKADALIRSALAARKNPLALVGLLKPSPLLVAKVLAKRATIPELERAVSRVLGARATALITPHADVGADLDDPEEAPAMIALMNARGLIA